MMKSVVALLLLAAVASYGVAADDDRACSSHIPTESEVGSVIDAIKSFWDKIWPFRHRREVNMDRLSASRRVPGSTLNQPIIIALHYFFNSFFSNLLSSSAYPAKWGAFLSRFCYAARLW